MNFLSTILGVVGGGLNSIFGLVTSIMQDGFKSAIRFHKEGIAFARDMGMSAKQAQAYTDVLIQRTQVLANKYGVSAEAILQVQRNLSEATGKQLMLNDAQAEGFVQINKLVGAQNTSRFTEEIMNGMGGQIDTVQGAISKVYATAAKQGLSAKKLTEKVAQNLSMANRLSFRNGIDGIARMAALSEKLGFNMQSVESAAGQFMDLDKAIENAAHMQMLGGSAGANFGNPLVAAYEANYDPEAFAQRLSDSLGSYATFDASKGISNINGMNMDFVRNIAKAMGISVDEASKMAKKQAEVKYKENALGSTLDKVAGGNEAKRNYILNNAQVTNNGRDLEIHGKNVNEITEKEWEDMMHFDGMTDSEIMAEQAKSLTSIDEHITGAADSVTAAFAKGIDKYLPGIGKKIQSLGDLLQGFSEQWGADTGKVIGKAMGWLNAHGDGITSVLSGILSGVTKIFNLVGEYTKTAIGIFLGWKLLLKPLLGGGILGAGKSSAASKAGKKLWGGIKETKSNLGAYTKYVKGNYKTLRSGGKGMMSSAWRAIKAPKVLSNGAITNGATNLFMGNVASNKAASMTAKSVMKGAATAGRIVKGGGVGILGTLGNMFADHLVESGQIEKGSAKHTALKVGSTAAEYGGIGATLGSIIPGLGTAVGGGIGAAIGAVKGGYDTWKSLPENADKGFFDFVGEQFTNLKNFFGEHFAPVINSVKGAITSISNAFKPIGDGILKAITKVFNGIWNGMTEVWGYVEPVLKEIGNTFNTIFGELFKTVSYWYDGAIAPAIGAVTPILGKIFNALYSFFGGVWNFISPIIEATFAVVKTGFKFMGGFFESLFGLLRGDIEPLKKNFMGMIDWFKELPGVILDWIRYKLPDWAPGSITEEEYQKRQEARAKAKGETHNAGGFINTGIPGVEHPVLAQKDEVILNRHQQQNFMKLANDYSSVLTNNSYINNVSSVFPKTIEVKSKPVVGEKPEYIYKLNSSETSTVNGNKVKVDDFKIDLSGTLKLDGGNSMKNIDINQLLSDTSFVMQLKDLIKQSINNDINNGRLMNDVAYMRGMPSPSTILGRR